MKILITGCAGFIGYHLFKALSHNKKNKIFGIDNLNKTYDSKIKIDRLNNLKKIKNSFFFKIDISNQKLLLNNFKKYKYDVVINLAAQAGVRDSVYKPNQYFKNNILGFYNILTASKEIKVKHLIYASSSSVYGNGKTPSKEIDNTDKPLSFYAASKKTNEILAYAFSNIYKLPTTGLRFFTVYGPFGRPDMALFLFTKAIIQNKKIKIFNKGKHTRDFTYVDDVIDGISQLILKPSNKKVPYSIYNIGSNNPVNLLNFIQMIEKKINKKTKKILDKFQIGDVIKTHADMTLLFKKIRVYKKTSLSEGIEKFIKWYLNYYKINNERKTK